MRKYVVSARKFMEVLPIVVSLVPAAFGAVVGVHVFQRLLGLSFKVEFAVGLSIALFGLGYTRGVYRSIRENWLAGVGVHMRNGVKSFALLHCGVYEVMSKVFN